ncbi:MAG: hypothetical protein GY784_16190, partial [Gammaproteobacteria bacterium]|nr:hypothetical protein [Gammaproteobacteria bacterium]
TAPGSKPTVINTGAGDVIALTGDNTHITGLLIDGNSNGDDGIDGGSKKTNIAITQNMIQKTQKTSGSMGVEFANDNKYVTVSGNTISHAFSGVQFSENNTDVTVSGNMISDMERDGVHFNIHNTDVAVSGNTISNLENGNGVFLDQNNTNVMVSGNMISNLLAGGSGVGTRGNNINVMVSGNTISNVDDHGIALEGGFNTDLMVSGNTISHALSGVYITNSNEDVTVSGNTISNVDDHGVFFAQDNEYVTVSGNTISDAGNVGVGFSINSKNVTVSGNTFTRIGNGDADDHVIEFNNTGNTLLPGSTGNVATTAPNAGNLCDGSFTGTFEVTDHNGVLQTFVDGVGCP